MGSERLPGNALCQSLNEALAREIAKGREDRERLDLALSASDMIAIWFGDLQKRLVFGDRNFARMYGVDEAEVTGGQPLGHYFSFIHPDDLPGAQAAMDRMMAGEGDYAHEHRIIRPDGSLLWVIARGRLIRDADGTPLRFPGVSIDITERKRIESRETFLLALERHLRDAADPREMMHEAAAHLGAHLGADRAGYGEADDSGDWFRVARDWCAPGMPSLAGTHRAGDFGTAVLAALQAGRTVCSDDVLSEPMTAGEVAARAYEAVATRAAITVPLIRQGRLIVVLFVHQRQKRRWRQDEVALCQDVALRTWSVVERARAEEAALRQAAQFQSFAQAMANHVWTAAPDGALDWLNERTYAYTGLPAGQLVGDGWARTVHPDDLPAVRERWQAALASGEQYEMEFRIRRHDGVFRWHLVRAVAIRGDDGALFRWVGTNTDIEDQKTTAQALADLNATLEEQVRQRTGDLMAAEESLRQSQKMEAVGQLTGGLAHDFNNLLTGISGSLELMATRLSQGRLTELDRYIRLAQGAAARAAALTHRLLAFSRQQTLDPRPIDVNRLVADMGELIRRTVGPAVSLETVAAGDLWPVLADPNQLENALLNLCINARDAMPDGGCITIETANVQLDESTAKQHDLPPGPYVLLCVSDTGVGMPPEVIARAFDPFFTTKPLGAGTGLGLSMVYGFVRQSGGQAHIVSAPGEGTRLCLHLPRHAGTRPAAVEAPASSVAPRAAPGETILVVDDESSVRALIVESLDELGYIALQAEDAKTGLAMVQAHREVDLLITDVGLPGGMNGRQLADAARLIRPDLKILFVTGYARNATLGDPQSGTNVVTKPFGLEMLAERIRQILSADKG